MDLGLSDLNMEKVFMRTRLESALLLGDRKKYLNLTITQAARGVEPCMKHSIAPRDALSPGSRSDHLYVFLTPPCAMASRLPESTFELRKRLR